MKTISFKMAKKLSEVVEDFGFKLEQSSYFRRYDADELKQMF